MSSSTQSLRERSKAQVPQLDQTLEAERDQVPTVVKEPEMQVDSLLQSFREHHQSLILDAENAFKVSADARDELQCKLQEEKQRVIELNRKLGELTRKLDETKNGDTTVKLASEKCSHGLTKIALGKSKRELEETRRQVVGLERDSKAAEQKNSDIRQQCDKLLTTLDAVNKRKAHVEAELELSKAESADFQQHLRACEQRNIDLEADLKAATERASGFEEVLKTFKSLFKRINDDMNSLDPSSEQRPTVTQSMSSTPALNEQGTAKQRDSISQTDDSLAHPQPQHSERQASNAMSDKESDILCRNILDELMDTTKNWNSNKYFLKAMDSLTLACHNAKVGPMNLSTMKEKLARGSYTSVTSFKADFDLIITDARRLNRPGNPVRIAAEQLSKIFDREFSSQPTPSHEPQQTERLVQGVNCKKRTAGSSALDTSQYEPAQKRRSLAPTEQSTDTVQPAISGARASLTPASTVSGQSKDATPCPEQTNANYVEGQITTSTQSGIDITLSAVAQLISFTKSPSTITGDWKSLVPDDYKIIAHTTPETAEGLIENALHSHKRDMITLRLLPAAGADNPKFECLLQHLIQLEDFAAVSHVGIDNVQAIYLVPSSKITGYPPGLPGLDHDLLPPTKAEDVLFMVIIFDVAEDNQMKIRNAWDQRMKAVQNFGINGLVRMRDALVRDPLHFQAGEVHGDECGALPDQD
ncbi:hypothetical protein DHEL01_v202145 [Diaporthe helianthi]|uniref:Bromo domain-containing protein n=1 Tax=Diaporthe helianthi TaxID=158607 RepID=A0A2P5IAH3_DIAHE|nr:hypothetical protein DHEL01_v202145 [Diaporthe helianthi]